MSINNRAPQVTVQKLMEWLSTTYAVDFGPTYPQSPSDGQFFYITSSPAHYAQWQQDISTWVDLGPSAGFSLGNLPTGTNPIQLKDTKSGGFVNLFVVYDQGPTNPAPLLMTDQGFIIKKDLAVGGNILSGQGAMIFGYGWTGSGSPSNPIAQSPPLIDLMNSSTSVKSGPSLPNPNDMNGQPGQIFHNTSDNKLYIWSGQYGDPSNTWIYSETNPTGKYDTLFLVKGDGYSPAHLHLGDLIVEAGHSVAPAGDGTSSIGLSTKMFQNMYTNNLVIGNYTAHSTRYITLANTDSAGGNSGLILNFNTSSAFGAIIPDYENPTPNKTMNLGDATHKWTNIYCTNLTVNAISGTANPLTIDTGLAINGNTRIAGYAQFNNDARLAWANDNTLEVQNDSGTPYSGNLNLNNIYISGSIQPIGAQGYISVGTLMNFVAGIRFNGDTKVIWVADNTVAVQDESGNTNNGVLDAGYVYTNNLGGLVGGTVALIASLSANGSVGTAGQVLTSRGAGLSPQWTTPASQQWTAGTVSSVTSPLQISSGALRILQATSSQSGYLSSTDWNTFNSKYGSGSSPSFGNMTCGTIGCGTITSTGSLYLTNNPNGYLWNNGGYIRQSGGNGFIADGTITSGGDITIARANAHLVMNATSGSPDIFFQQNGTTKMSCGYWTDVGQFHIYDNVGSKALLTLANNGQLILPVNGVNAGLRLGDDTYLYRGTTNTLYVYNNIEPGGGTNQGYLGEGSRYWYGLVSRYVYYKSLSTFDEYDDLSIVKLWGETDQTLPETYDKTKLIPPADDPFKIIKGNKENADTDEFFDAGKVNGFLMGCAKTLSKKQDQQDAIILNLLNQIESLQSEIASIKTSMGVNNND